MYKEEILTETEEELGNEDYVTERNKPMPNILHGNLQIKHRLSAKIKIRQSV